MVVHSLCLQYCSIKEIFRSFPLFWLSPKVWLVLYIVIDIWQSELFLKKYINHSQALEKYIYSQINHNCKFRSNICIYTSHTFLHYWFVFGIMVSQISNRTQWTVIKWLLGGNGNKQLDKDLAFIKPFFLRVGTIIVLHVLCIKSVVLHV